MLSGAEKDCKLLAEAEDSTLQKLILPPGQRHRPFRHHEERIMPASPAPLHRIIIFVGDVQKCASFYCEVFGFKPLPGGDAGWTELETGGCRLAFHKVGGPKGKSDAPTGGPDNPHKIVFFVEDVPAMREAIIARGVKMGKIYNFESITFCDGHDPEGHVFQISNRP